MKFKSSEEWGKFFKLYSRLFWYFLLCIKNLQILLYQYFTKFKNSWSWWDVKKGWIHQNTPKFKLLSENIRQKPGWNCIWGEHFQKQKVVEEVCISFRLRWRPEQSWLSRPWTRMAAATSQRRRCGSWAASCPPQS